MNWQSSLPIRVEIQELELSFGLPPFVGERLAIQLERADRGGARDHFIARLQIGFEHALAELIDLDLTTPTRQQIEAAVDLARVRLISIPGEALRYRGSMEQFLARHR
ncbi:hypothetical protein [Xanthomonas arboricola]|uniref:hypothetical protein n=1 Tax=Xanthomonas arboricola TaxID=56448 RepID=UPI0023B940A5|nr:hypothetical protein [Xanthomonas arboricola]